MVRLSIGVLPLSLGQMPLQALSGREVLRLPVHVYNMAAVPARVHANALEAASRILATAGISPEWEEGATDASEAHTLDMSYPGSAVNCGLDVRPFLVLRII